MVTKTISHFSLSLQRAFRPLALIALALPLAGCGGGSSLIGGSSRITNNSSTPVGAAAQTLQLGPLTTRTAGVVPPPVTEGSSGAVTTGLAGTITEMDLNLTSPKIYFSRSSDGVHADLYTMNPDGTQVTKAVSIGGMQGGFAIARDNSKIAYATQVTRNNVTTQDIYVANPDGSQVTNLTNGAGTNSYPSFSPDGSKLIFRRQTTTVANGTSTTTTDLYTIHTDGTQLTNLTNNDGTGGDTYPSFSPDGTKIVYVRPVRSGSPTAIYTINATGSNRSLLLSGGSHNLDAPAWSPDGARIVFIDTNPAVAGTSNVCCMDSDGLNPTTIEKSGHDNQPSFSPDGKRVAYVINNNGISQLAAIDLDGSHPAQLSNGSYDTLPRWGSGTSFRTLIGSTPSGPAAFGTTAAGFFYSQQDNPSAIPCLATFTAATSTTSQITALTGGNTGLPLMAFGLQADQITSLKFINHLTSLTGPLSPVSVGLPNNVNNALVTFNGATGQLSSVLSFFTTGTAQITPQPGVTAGSPLAVFNIQANPIATVNYANINQQVGTIQPVPVVISPTTTNILVTFSGSTGLLTSLLPYTITRAAAAPRPTFANGACVLHGHFTAVFDAQGNNRASQGATEVRLDANTGSLLSAQ